MTERYWSAFMASAALLSASAFGAALDDDGDGVADNVDNCLSVANADQRDTDTDGIGNACDQDTNNDCVVNFGDLGELKAAFFSTPTTPDWNPEADFDGDSVVSFADLAALKAAFFGTPGPSGGQNECSCVPPAPVPAVPNAEFNGATLFLLGSFSEGGAAVAGVNDFSDQGGGRYVARVYAGSAGSFDYTVADQASSIEYCSDALLAPYADQTIPFFGCSGSTGIVDIPAPGCYEFAVRAEPGSVLPPAVDLALVERLGRWEIDVDGAGGVFTVPNGVQLDIPPGAVAAPVSLTIGDLPCQQVDGLFAETAVNTHDNRCIGGFTGEPDGFTFAAPVTATVPVDPLVAEEIPLWLTSSNGAADYGLIPNSQIAYDGLAPAVTATFEHFSIVAAAGGTNRGPSITSTGDLPACCSQRPTPPGCCCTTVTVVTSEGDTAGTDCDCQLLGQDLEVEFPLCPGSPVQTVRETHATADCPTDLQASIVPQDLILWTCEDRDVALLLTGTNRDGSVCSLPLPITATAADAQIASVTETGPNTARVSGQTGGATSIDVSSLVGSQFSFSAPVTVVPLDGEWQVGEVGEQTCMTGIETTFDEDIAEAPAQITVDDCAAVTVDFGFPGATPQAGTLTATGDPGGPFEFELTSPDPASTIACVLFNSTDGQVVDFGTPVCPQDSMCRALSCSEDIMDTGTIGPASAGLGAGTSSWTFTADWELVLDEGEPVPQTTSCEGVASTFFLKQ